jgi:NTE family protein
MYETITLSGSSTNGMITLGALQYIYDKHLHQSIKHYVGTSSGSVLGTLLSIGYTPLELMCKVCIDKAYDRIHNFNISSMVLLGKGLINFQQIEDILYDGIMEKIGFIPTLKQIKETFGKTVVYVTYNMTLGQREYISYVNFPELSCLAAIRMSSSLPFVFTPYEVNENIYVDGGIVDNFPLEYAEKTFEGMNLGICIVSPTKIDHETDNINFLKSLVYILLRTVVEDTVSRSKPTTDTVLIEQTSSFFNFNATNHEILSMFDIGYDKCKTQLNKYTNTE